MLVRKPILLFVAAMCAIVAASNFLVQFPVQVALGGVNLADFLTWGAFTYPVAFLVTDMTNRTFGVRAARRVVFAGFVLAVIFSIWLSSPRIAIASCTAFLAAQLLDVTIFDRLRASSWWKAPLISTIIGSALDTVLFFSLAFAPAFGALDFGGPDGSLGFLVPFLGIGGDVPLWISIASGDFVVKFLVGFVMLLPYRFIAQALKPRTVSA